MRDWRRLFDAMTLDPARLQSKPIPTFESLIGVHAAGAPADTRPVDAYPTREEDLRFLHDVRINTELLGMIIGPWGITGCRWIDRPAGRAGPVVFDEDDEPHHYTDEDFEKALLAGDIVMRDAEGGAISPEVAIAEHRTAITRTGAPR